MTILKQEIRSQKTATLIWSLSIGFMIAVCILMFPEMKSQMSDVNKLFASMGSFTQAFGMDKLNFGTAYEQALLCAAERLKGPSAMAPKRTTKTRK